MFGGIFHVVESFEDKSLIGRQVIGVEFEFTLKENGLWEARFSTCDTHEPCVLSHLEIVHESNWQDYLDGYHVPGRDPLYKPFF